VYRLDAETKVAVKHGVTVRRSYDAAPRPERDHRRESMSEGIEIAGSIAFTVVRLAPRPVVRASQASAVPHKAQTTTAAAAS
jgi:hypothetical protein